MKKALIQSIDNRIAQVVAAGAEFPVSNGLEWRDCADGVTPETHNFDGAQFTLKPAQQLAPTPDADPRAVLDETERAFIKSDPAFKQVIDSTKADVDAWVATNFASMTAPNRARFSMFIWLGIVGIRRQIRSG